jgi:hypothetical protein
MSYDKSLRRDQQTANDAQSDRKLMCSAIGCPNRWSASESFGPDIKGMCSAHFFAHPSQWDSITREQQWKETERARNPKPVADVGETSFRPDVLRAAMEMLTTQKTSKTPAQTAIDNILSICAERGSMSMSQRSFVARCKTMLHASYPRLAQLEQWA